eukprot:g460.t1
MMAKTAEGSQPMDAIVKTHANALRHEIEKIELEVAKLEREVIAIDVADDAELIKRQKEEAEAKAKAAADLESAQAQEKENNSAQPMNVDGTDSSSSKKDEEIEKDDESDVSDDDDECDMWKAPKRSVPICADVRKFDFLALAEAQKKATGRLFDIIHTDPPWQLASANPTRGVAIGYQQLSDTILMDLPFEKLQTDGLIFLWVINAKFRLAMDLLDHWGYELVDEIVWCKATVNRRVAKSHGYYLQHAKEVCLVGKKGKLPPNFNGNIKSDIIFSERRGQSQKPEEIYEIMDAMVPGGSKLEVFARRNNLHDHWVSIGNEL